MTIEYKGPERRKADDRRGVKTRRHIKSGFFMGITVVDRRSGMDRRAGLDRREALSKTYHKNLIIKIQKKSIIKHWDPEKAKMTYLWEKGLRAITFKKFKPGEDVNVEIILAQTYGQFHLKGKILRTEKIFTERGFATEMDIQFHDLTEQEISEINNIIWS